MLYQANFNLRSSYTQKNIFWVLKHGFNGPALYEVYKNLLKNTKT